MKTSYKVLLSTLMCVSASVAQSKENTDQILYESAYCAQVKEVLGSQKNNSSFKRTQIEEIEKQLNVPCDAHKNAPLVEAGSSGTLNSMKVVMQMEPKSAGQLEQVYEHLYQLVLGGSGVSDTKTDYVLYKGILRNLKSKSVQVMMQDFAHVKKTQIMINGLKTNSQWPPQQKIDDGFKRTYTKVNALFKQHIVDMYPAIAINNERLEYALESEERLQAVRQAHSKLIPKIFEQEGSKNAFYKEELSAAECSFVQAFYPGQTVLRDAQIRCAAE